MTRDQILTLVILGGIILLFLSNRARYDLVGLLGLLVAVPFWVARAAGALVDGAVTLATPGATGALRRQIFGEGYGLFALAIFGAVGGPRLVASGLAESYVALPVGRGVSANGASVLLLATGARLIAAAAAIAAPALAALLLADLAAGFIARVQPAAAQLLGAQPQFCGSWQTQDAFSPQAGGPHGSHSSVQ